ncbi:YihY family inner membrane protein [Niveispirillum sp.]|uniref:YihY family inner membrane protein n=1 Tax=Niveispirillum sp. TaxID=1917217 RepID=UPI0025DAF717|nr:YihY family inner membrane protein [Niveispirillum sp.]
MLRDGHTIMAHAARRFTRDKGFVSASALTYTTLLALVPLLTVIFAIFTAFPAYKKLRQQAETLLFQSLVPQVGDQIQAYAGTFVAKAGALTGFGVIGLTITAILLFFSIEGALNSIWRAAEPRPLLTRLLSFWAVLTMAPLLLGASLSLGLGVLARMKADGDPGLALALSAIPFLFETAAFTFMYVAIPNREVAWKDALAGGAVAGLATEVAKTGFSLYLTLFPTYEAIYGALSVVPTFLLWLYLFWSVILFGAELAASLPEWRAGRLNGEEGGLSTGQRLMVALAVLDTLHQASRHGVGMKREALARRVPVGGAVIDDILEALRRAHWVDRSGRGAWMVSRDLHRATLADLRLALDLAIRGENAMAGRLDASWAPQTADLITHAELSGREMLNVSLATIFASQNDREAPSEPA